MALDTAAALDYGWTVRLEDLFYHAYAHSVARNLRLARRRQANMSASQTAGIFNLSRLPVEIFDTILKQSALNSVEEARYSTSIISKSTIHGCLEEEEKDRQLKQGEQTSLPYITTGMTNESHTTCKSCISQVNTFWAEAARFDELEGDAFVDVDNTSISGSQIIKRYLNESNHMALKLAPSRIDESCLQQGWITAQLRSTVFAIVPRTTPNLSRQFYEPTSKERVYAWTSRSPHPLERLPPLSPLRSLFKSVKLDFVMLADPSNETYKDVIYDIPPQAEGTYLDNSAGYWQAFEPWTYAWRA